MNNENFTRKKTKMHCPKKYEFKKTKLVNIPNHGKIQFFELGEKKHLPIWYDIQLIPSQDNNYYIITNQ